jgi:16S rRNA (guanine527-N7)-methyltransferase
MTSSLAELITEAQRRGFVGDAPVEEAVRHARGFATGVDIPPVTFIDLGSGGGLPGLALIDVWPDARAVLVDANQKRCAFLRDAVEALGVDDRVSVLEGRAEALGRSSEHRGAVDVIVARGFGRPAVTAECAAPFLRVGGLLVVSEPPDALATDARWPSAGLEASELGLVREKAWTEAFSYQSLRQVSPCPERFPRRVGVPAKRPLF